MTMKNELSQGSKSIVMIVDDTPGNLALLSDMLLESGYRVLVATDGLSALEQIQFITPDIVLLDVMMPDLDGGELATRFKSNPKLKDVPIVFLTAAVTKGEIAAGGGQLGGFPFLAKPVVLKEVIACLKHHLGA